jgi:hypothetical protein
MSTCHWDYTSRLRPTKDCGHNPRFDANPQLVAGFDRHFHCSLLASCKRHGHDPWVYYRDVLTRLPAILPGAGEDEFLALLDRKSVV